ncbi:MAG: PhnD/SsuA/transferrin family substrate-binding protein [Bacillota bacterium]
MLKSVLLPARACVFVTIILAAAPWIQASSGQVSAQSLPVVRAPVLASGVTAVIQALAEAKGFDRAHGFRFESSAPYNSLDAYYADFIKGQFDVEIGITETYAVRFLRGAPIRLLSTMTVNGSEIVVRDPSIRSVADLKGKTIVAPLTSGRYLLARALLREYHGLDLERDAQVISAPSPTAALTFLLAGRADAALSWEPAVTVTLQANPGLRLLFETDR